MWRAFWIAGIVVSLFAALLAYASSTATFLFKHPRSAARIVIDQSTGQPIAVGKLAEAQDLRSRPQPRVECKQDEHDFGIMDPLSMGRHEFVLKNVGTAPLKLTAGPTTCKCTLSGLDKREVAPGEEALVTLEWNTGRTVHYSHSATIYTNDPDRKSLDVRVSGIVRMQLGTDVKELVLADLAPGKDAATECLLYTQAWDGFEVESIDSRLAGLTWEVTEAQPSDAPQLEARAVKRLRITVPANGLASRFGDSLRIHAKVAGQEKVYTLDLPIQGNVLGRYTVYGGDIVADAIQLGSLPWGRGKQSRLVLKIRDGDPVLHDIKVTVQPSFLAARLAPRNPGGPGLYDLFLELPADAAVCQFLGTPQGEVTITSSHPRIGNIQIPVRFAVLAADE